MKKKTPTSKRRTQNAVGSDALVRLDLLRNGKPISPLEAVNQLLCRKNIRGVSACEIMEEVRAALALKINHEASSEDFRPFFAKIDNDAASEVLGMEPNTKV
ncbi:MAG: hypothetical protein BWY57_02982 [Betaproteobacteria bacterium ADurb.Bin341]|nr:MAG: hypothetical protein BWY57_02982 [Betaproteobacteria bacterium ADurb.Bin341]